MHAQLDGSARPLLQGQALCRLWKTSPASSCAHFGSSPSDCRRLSCANVFSPQRVCAVHCHRALRCHPPQPPCPAHLMRDTSLMCLHRPAAQLFVSFLFFSSSHKPGLKAEAWVSARCPKVAPDQQRREITGGPGWLHGPHIKGREEKPRERGKKGHGLVVRTGK